MKNEKGLALFIVLIFLQIFVLLGLYALEKSRLDMKMSGEVWQNYLMQNAAEEVLKKIEIQHEQYPQNCIIPATSTQFLQKQSIDWWRSFCFEPYSSYLFFYVIEPLGEDSCAQTEDNRSADYYRITLLEYVQSLDAKLLLQSTIIKPHQNGSISGCQEPVHRVTIGRQMWRAIN